MVNVQRRKPHWHRAAVVLAAICAVACGNGTAPATSAGPATPTAAPVTAAPVTAATVSAATVSAAPAVTTGRCTAADLRVTQGPTSGTAGSVYRSLVFTNAGTRTCGMRGFPGVSYVAGDDGHQVGPAAQMSGERGAEVPLPPGDSATAELQLVQVRNFDAAVCRPTPVRGLRVYPPGDTVALFVVAAGTGCAGTPPGPQLTVRTVARGR